MPPFWVHLYGKMKKGADVLDKVRTWVTAGDVLCGNEGFPPCWYGNKTSSSSSVDAGVEALYPALHFVGIEVNDLVPTVREDLNDGYCMSKELHEIVRAYDWYKNSEHMQIRELLLEPRPQGVPQAFLDVASWLEPEKDEQIRCEVCKDPVVWHIGHSCNDAPRCIYHLGWTVCGPGLKCCKPPCRLPTVGVLSMLCNGPFYGMSQGEVDVCREVKQQDGRPLPHWFPKVELPREDCPWIGGNHLAHDLAHIFAVR